MVNFRYLVPFRYRNTRFNFPQLSLSGALALVVRKATTVCMSRQALVATNSSWTIVWWNAIALSSSNGLASFSSWMSKSLLLLFPLSLLETPLSLPWDTPPWIPEGLRLFWIQSQCPGICGLHLHALSTWVHRYLPSSRTAGLTQSHQYTTPFNCPRAISLWVALCLPRICWQHMGRKGSPQTRIPPALCVASYRRADLPSWVHIVLFVASPTAWASPFCPLWYTSGIFVVRCAPSFPPTCFQHHQYILIYIRVDKCTWNIVAPHMPLFTCSSCWSYEHWLGWNSRGCRIFLWNIGSLMHFDMHTHPLIFPFLLSLRNSSEDNAFALASLLSCNGSITFHVSITWSCVSSDTAASVLSMPNLQRPGFKLYWVIR